MTVDSEKTILKDKYDTLEVHNIDLDISRKIRQGTSRLLRRVSTLQKFDGALNDQSKKT